MICEKCKTKYCNGKNCTIIEIIKKYAPKKVNTHFFGSSPPAIFVGDYNYPYVYAGILAPSFHDELSYRYDAPEEWFKQQLSIEQILAQRSAMIYSRFQTPVKQQHKFVDVMQEISMSSKICDVEFYLKDKPKPSMSLSHFRSPIGNPALLQKAIITSNVSVHTKVEKSIRDTDLKAADAVFDLYYGGISVTNISKLLSAGLLGLEKRRKLTPTRWSITAVDDMLSKKLVAKIKTFPQISEYMVFHEEYLGNHYEILLIPSSWSFEVLEVDSQGRMWHDYEGVFGRKAYAESVTGVYYANRLGVCEYLAAMKRQASVLILREIKDTYWAPCGVGILREIVRSAVKKKPTMFPTENEALQDMQRRLSYSIQYFLAQSLIGKEKKEQLLLSQFS